MVEFRAKTLLTIAFSIIYFKSLSKAQPRDCMSPYCLCLNITTLLCSNFSSFKQLDFQRVSGILFESVELRPLNRRLDLNENLKFNGLKLNGRLTLNNLNSFHAFYNPFRQILYDKFSLAILNSNFKFVGYGSTGNLNAENSILNYCNFQVSAQNFDFIFSNLRIIEFTLSGVFFEQTICPILFRNTRIFNFILIDPFGAYGYKNLTSTGIYSDDVSLILNANIRHIEFDFTKSTNILQQQWIDSQSIINPILFEQLDRINLNSARRLQYIQEDTFKYLNNVRRLEIKNVNFKNLLMTNRRWLKNLNYNTPTYDIDNLKLNASISSKVFQLIIWANNEWSFNADSDICLFRNFPHNKLVFPFLLFTQASSFPCTCTIYWLYKYIYKYQALYNLNQEIVPFHCFQQSNWDNCRFEALFNKYCPNSEAEPEENFTTLRPNTNVLPNFETSSSTSTTNPTTTIMSSTTTSLGLITPTITVLTSFFISTTTSYGIASSAIPINQISQEYIRLSTGAFYMAIVLSVITSFMITILVILYIKTLSPKHISIISSDSSKSSDSRGSIIKI